MSFRCFHLIRQQNGQLVTENFGVVIQEIVDSDVAGVLFTCNPMDGDETKLDRSAHLGYWCSQLMLGRR